MDLEKAVNMFLAFMTAVVCVLVAVAVIALCVKFPPVIGFFVLCAVVSVPIYKRFEED